MESTRRHRGPAIALGRLLAVLCLVAPAAVMALATPARAAFVYDGTQYVPGPLTFAAGDTLLGVDLTAAGTVTIGAGVSVRAVGTTVIRAPRIVIAGSLDGDGGATAAALGGGDGQSGAGGCGGGGGGGSAGAGGDGGSAGSGGLSAGGTGGAAALSGPGRPGGDGGTCGTGLGGGGGAGGASIHLISPDIEITGTVTANGTLGQAGTGPLAGSGSAAGGGGGGGGGGEVLLSGPTDISATGRVTAKAGPGGDGGPAAGGQGGGGGGSGSGGRIEHSDPLTVDSSAIVDASQALLPFAGRRGAGGAAQDGSFGAPGVVSPVTATTTAVSSSLNSSTVDDVVIFTATVAPPTAVGTVTFTADGLLIAGCERLSLTAGSSTCSTATLAEGNHPISAYFTPTPGADFGGSIGTLDGGQQVDAAAVAVPQSITFPTQPDRIVGAAPFALTGVSGGGSDNPVTFGALGPCGVTGETVTLTGVGTCTITADQAGNSEYLAAPTVSQSFAISYAQRVISVSASGRRGGVVAVVLRLTDAGGRNLSAAAVPVRATAFDGGPLGQVLTQTQNFQYRPLLGSYTVTDYVRSGLTRGTHTLTFTAGADPRPHTITFTTF